MAADVDIGPRNKEGVTAATPQISLNPNIRMIGALKLTTIAADDIPTRPVGSLE